MFGPREEKLGLIMFVIIYNSFPRVNESVKYERRDARGEVNCMETKGNL